MTHNNTAADVASASAYLTAATNLFVDPFEKFGDDSMIEAVEWELVGVLDAVSDMIDDSTKMNVMALAISSYMNVTLGRDNMVVHN